MTNIFQDAQFGDKFITKNQTIVILVSLYTDCAFLMYKEVLSHNHFGNRMIKCRLDGICLNEGKYDEFDIVSEYLEPIKILYNNANNPLKLI